jgi:hypothetical protein
LEAQKIKGNVSLFPSAGGSRAIDYAALLLPFFFSMLGWVTGTGYFFLVGLRVFYFAWVTFLKCKAPRGVPTTLPSASPSPTHAVLLALQSHIT